MKGVIITGLLEPVLKHPGHADQKVHGHRGTAVADLPDGWRRQSDEERVAAIRADASWLPADSRADEYIREMDTWEVYEGPNGSKIKVDKDTDIPHEALAEQMKQLSALQGIAPIPGQNVYISDRPFQGHNLPDSTKGFVLQGDVNIHLRPSAVTDGMSGPGLMPVFGTKPHLYAITHEYGHALDKRPSSTASSDKAEVISKHQTGMSRYAYDGDPDGGAGREAFAEAWTAWVGTDGSSMKPFVRFYADKYGWSTDSIENYYRSQMSKQERPMILADTFTDEGALLFESVDWERQAAERAVGKTATIAFAPGLRPVLKHLPGKHDQKSHGHPGMKSDVAQSILHRVKENGGLSVNMLDGSEPTSGYMVAKGGDIGDIVPAERFFDPKEGPKALGSFLKQHRKDLTGGSYLGLWHNTEDGNVYLDVSDNILDRGTAERAGRDRNQISIWDVANFQEINTGGTGELAKTTSGDPDAGPVEDDGRGDRRLRQEGVGDVHRPRGVVFGFDPGFRPILKHADHNQQSHAGGSADVYSEIERYEEGVARALMRGDYSGLDVGSSRLAQRAGGAVGNAERRIANFAARFGQRFRSNKRRTYTAEEATALREAYYERYGRPTWMQKAVAWLKGLLDD